MSIYLDNAATTAVLPEAAKVAAECMTALYANPASLHSFGFEAEKLLEKLTGCYVLDYEKSYLTIGTDRNSDLSGRMIENDFYIESATAVDRIVSGDEKKHQESVDITGYIERCERIKNNNPDMSAELSHDIFGGLSKMLLTE